MRKPVALKEYVMCIENFIIKHIDYDYLKFNTINATFDRKCQGGPDYYSSQIMVLSTKNDYDEELLKCLKWPDKCFLALPWTLSLDSW